HLLHRDLYSFPTRRSSDLKILSHETRRAALAGVLGLAGETNASGDAQKKLDVFSNETVVQAFVGTGLVAAIVSEELEETRHISRDRKSTRLNSSHVSISYA